MQRITILGSTGSIGTSTLDVVARHPGRFEIFALTGATQVERMFEQCRVHRPKYAVMTIARAAAELRERLRNAGLATEVLEGGAALTEVATHPEVDTVMAAIVGAAGLPATLAAAQAGKRILLANKETLVVSGQLFMDAIAASGAELLPIDSEHNAIFQALPREFNGDFLQAGVRSLWLTASGGPFRQLSAEQIARATPEQAIAHHVTLLHLADHFALTVLRARFLDDGLVQVGIEVGAERVEGLHAALPEQVGELRVDEGDALPVRVGFAARVGRERDEYQDRLLRKTAEFDNYRKRIERERREQADQAIVNLMQDLLPVVDGAAQAVSRVLRDPN